MTREDALAYLQTVHDRCDATAAQITLLAEGHRKGKARLAEALEALRAEPAAPEPQEQLWYVTQRQSAGLLVNVVLYRNRHDGDCDNRWGREWEARKFPLAEAGAVIESEATRPGSRAVYVYGIEPAGRVRA